VAGNMQKEAINKVSYYIYFSYFLSF